MSEPAPGANGLKLREAEIHAHERTRRFSHPHQAIYSVRRMACALYCKQGQQQVCAPSRRSAPGQSLSLLASGRLSAARLNLRWATTVQTIGATVVQYAQHHLHHRQLRIHKLFRDECVTSVRLTRLSRQSLGGFTMLRLTIRAPLRARALTSTPPPPSAAATEQLNMLPDLPCLAALGHSVFAGTPRAEVTFLMGGPGSGKGTLSALVRSRVGHGHISVGELLREEQAKDSSLGRSVASVIDQGGIVPSSVAIRLLLQQVGSRLREMPVGVERTDWVIDGFPRKLKSAEMWETLGFGLKRVVALDVDEHMMAERLRNRGRKDDTPEIIKSRIEHHWKEWPKIKDFYQERGLLTIIDASGESEETWERFMKASPGLRERGEL